MSSLRMLLLRRRVKPLSATTRTSTKPVPSVHHHCHHSCQQHQSHRCYYNHSSTHQRLTVSLTRHWLQTGVLTVPQLLSYCHALAVAGDDCWDLGAFLEIRQLDALLEDAQESVQRWKDGTARPLEGMPVSIKANLACREFSLTASSKILQSHDDGNETGGGTTSPLVGCGYDADVVQKLRLQGAIVLGQTQMDEFGMGSLGTNHGIVRGKDIDNDDVLDKNRQPQGYTKNPLPYLAATMTMMRKKNQDVSMTATPDWLLQQIQQPYDSILAAHDEIQSTMTNDRDLLDYSPGGSSCGSAVSVAHGSSLLSLGSDTGGSVRLPAAWCGVVGLKPTYGLFSRHGLVNYASSLDTIGILGPSVACVGQVVDMLRVGHNDSVRDSNAQVSVTTTKTGGSEPSATASVDLTGIRIGIPAAFMVQECPDEVRKAWIEAAETLVQHGATVEQVTTEELSPDVVQSSLAAYYVLSSAEASSNLSRYDGFRYGRTVMSSTDTAGRTRLEGRYQATRTDGFGTEVKRRILCGTSVLSSNRFHSHYESAAKLRGILTQQLERILSVQSGYDALLTPTVLSAVPATISTDNSTRSDPTAAFAYDVMTVPVSLAGLPALSVPIIRKKSCDDNDNDVGRKSPGDNKDTAVDGETCSTFPIGMQIIGGRNGEDMVLTIAKALESSLSKGMGNQD